MERKTGLWRIAVLPKLRKKNNKTTNENKSSNPSLKALWNGDQGLDLNPQQALDNPHGRGIIVSNETGLRYQVPTRWAFQHSKSRIYSTVVKEKKLEKREARDKPTS